MAWKLKKSKTDEAGEVSDLANESAALSDFPGTVQTEPTSVLQAGDSPNDFFASRMDDADDAIASLNSAKTTPATHGVEATGQSPPPTKAEEVDDWSMDAFAPYKPSDKMQAGHLPEFKIDAADATFTPATHAANGIEAGDTTDFAMFSPAQDDDALPLETLDFSSGISSLDDADWQLGESGDAQTEEMSGSVEPIIDVSEPRKLDGTLSQGHIVTNGHTLSAVDAADDDEDLLQASMLSDVTPARPAIDFDDHAITPPGDIPNGIIADLPLPAETPVIAAGPAHPPIAAPTSAGIAQLIVRLGAFSATYDVGEKEMVIGRPDPKTGAVPEIVIEWDDAISRRHAQVFRQADKYYVQDMDSKNGTFLNGRQLPPSTPVQLSSGDKIRVGERTEITFQI